MHSLVPSLSRPRAPLGSHLGIDFDVVAWAHADAEVDLSVACMFEHEPRGAAISGGLLQLDQALDGALSAARSEGHFRARWLDTLLISCPPTRVRARNVLVVGLGDPGTLSDETLERACGLAASQALLLRARSAAFAPNLLDAGLFVPPTLRPAHAMMRGVLTTLSLTSHFAQLGLDGPSPLRSWTFDAGASHFGTVVDDFALAFDESTNVDPSRAFRA